ncbi:MAG: phosphoesterase [Cardiobacteriaceae bacterium]|nr:phosphoesterase [Cardiobacteriaceae bacterium]
MSRLFFTADLHFHHANILKLAPQFRPFADLQEMESALVEAWNQTVSPDDIVYNLGDFSLSRSPEQVVSVLQKLHGQHHLILGNHDHLLLKHQTLFLNTPKHDGHPLLSSIQHYLYLPLPEKPKRFAVLHHYPIQEWDGCFQGSYHLHGHIHNRIAPIKGRLLNVGWDLHGRLLSLEDIRQFLEPLPVFPYPNTPTLTHSATEQIAYLQSALQTLNT